jgi:hypothetical protein
MGEVQHIRGRAEVLKLADGSERVESIQGKAGHGRAMESKSLRRL